MVTVSGWLNEPDVPEGDTDIDRMDPLACAQGHAEFRRPIFDRVAAPPSLVSRMVRKSAGRMAAPTRPLHYQARPSLAAGLPPAVALALALSED